MSPTESTTSTSPADSKDDVPADQTLYRAVASAVNRLSGGLLGESHSASAHARGLLSRIRRGAGQAPGQDPVIWSLIMEEVLPELPEHEIGRGAEPTRGEWAAFTAVTLYALHQQSLSQSMHRSARNLGQAVGELRRRSESESIKSRLDALLVSTTPRGLQYHLRSLVGLLNAYEIPLDYGRLAEDLKRLRTPRGRSQVAITWGRGYVQSSRPTSNERAAEP